MAGNDRCVHPCCSAKGVGGEDGDDGRAMRSEYEHGGMDSDGDKPNLPLPRNLCRP